MLAPARQCAFCCGPINPQNRRYCSLRCFGNHVRREHAARPMPLCVVCGEPVAKRHRKTCSELCRRIAIQRGQRNRRPPRHVPRMRVLREPRKCARCGQPTPSKGHKYCLACRCHNKNNRRPDPTPMQIAARTAVIRARWTPEEREQRACGCFRVREWNVPEVLVVSLVGGSVAGMPG